MRHAARNLGGRPTSPQVLAEDALMEFHAFIDRAGAEFISDFHVLSKNLHRCKTKSEVAAQLHLAMSHFAEKLVRLKTRTREITRQVSGLAA